MLWSLSPPPSRIPNLQLSFSLFYIITSSFLSIGSFSSAHTPARVSSTFKTASFMSTTSLDLIFLQLQTYLPAFLPSRPSQKNDLYLLSSLFLLSFIFQLSCLVPGSPNTVLIKVIDNVYIAQCSGQFPVFCLPLSCT